MKAVKPGYCFFLFLLLPFTSVAQDNNFTSLEKLTIANDLSSNIVTDIVQDNDGYLWIVTADGLNRFDGAEMVQFFHDSTANSIPSNYIKCLALMPGNKLVLGTANGLCVYDLHKKNFETFHYSSDSSFERYDNFINCLLIDKQGKVWAGGPTCILRFSPQLKFEKVFRSPFTANDIGKERFNFASKIIPIENNKLLFFLTTGNFVYEPSLDTLISINDRKYEHLSFLRNKYYWDVFEIGDKRLVYLNKGVDSIFLYSGKTNTIYSAHFPLNKYDYISWEQQLSRVNDTQFVISFHTHGYSQLTITDNKIVISRVVESPDVPFSKMIADRQGNWWFINRFGGLIKRPKKLQGFEDIPLGDEAKKTSGDFAVSSMKKIDGQLWVASYGAGIFAYDPVSNKQRQVFFQGTYDDGNCNFTWQIHKHNTDTLWVGTQTGMFWLSEKSLKYGRLIHYRDRPSVLDSFAITTQFEDHKNRLWIGIGKGNGVCVYDKIKRSFRYYKGKDNDAYIFRCPLDIKSDSHNRLWFISDNNNKLLYYDEAHDKFVPVAVPTRDAMVYGFTCLYIDKQDIFWIGSNSGMIRFDPATATSRFYGREKGICNSIVHDIYPDRSGNLWLATEGGLSRFDPTKEQFTNYYKRNGLPAEVFSSDFLEDKSTGLLYTGGVGRVIAFDPGILTTSSSVPVRLLIDGLEVSSKTYYPEAGRLFTLKSHQKSFTVKFSAIDLVNGPPINKYYYQLKGGGDSSWVALGHQRLVSFSNLGPGNYSLSIRSVDEAGNTNSQPVVLLLRVTPSFVQTAWFYILVFLFIAALFYGFYRYRIRQLLAMERVRSNISRDLHDEIGANLANISYLSLLAQKNINDSDQVYYWLTRIHDNTKDVSESMREIVWSINPENDSIEHSIPRMLRYASELLEAKGIQLVASLPADMDNIRLDMDQRRDLYLIFKEAINNLAKHSGATTARIVFRLSGGKLYMAAEDNGKGFNQANPVYGNGIKNMKDRAAKQNWKIEIETEKSIGTRIKLEAQIA